eukprot:SAG31_NODE_20666_length_568_cov_1.072495_2_plen_41_part_01
MGLAALTEPSGAPKSYERDAAWFNRLGWWPACLWMACVAAV